MSRGDGGAKAAPGSLASSDLKGQEELQELDEDEWIDEWEDETTDLEEGRLPQEEGPQAAARLSDEKVQAMVEEYEFHTRLSGEPQKVVKVRQGKGVELELIKVDVGDDPIVKYNQDKTLMIEALDRGELQAVSAICRSLLARQSDDPEVWRGLTQSKLRLRTWDAALVSARQWIEVDPYSLNPRCAEAFALAGMQRYGEARARFAALAREVELKDPLVARELRECAWRVDELWIDHIPGVCTVSARPATIFTGARPPHFFLPNFADSIGPVEVLPAAPEEPGGGAIHSRKLVVTRDVEAGELLFVQTALVFGTVYLDAHMERLAEALLVAAMESPRAAALVDLLKPDTEPEVISQSCAIMQKPSVTRTAGTWSAEPEELAKNLNVCQQIVETYVMRTGHELAGIWPIAAMARHSCAPSALRTCFGDAMIARAARDLKKGDEVTFDLFEVLQIKEEREVAARDLFGSKFKCRCARCEAESRIVQGSLKDARDKMRKEFVRNWSRTTCIREMLDIKLEKAEMAKERIMKELSNKEKIAVKQGLLGLADVVRESRTSDKKFDNSLLAKVQDVLPTEPVDYDNSLIAVPEDLFRDLYGAISEFQEEVTALQLSPQEEGWICATAYQCMNDVMVLLTLMENLPAQKKMAEWMMKALTQTCPGSFLHVHVACFMWERVAENECIGMKLEDITPALEVAAAERKLVNEALDLRYGKDLQRPERSAAMARVLSTKQMSDENWMWEVSWCLGKNPGTSIDKSDTGRAVSPVSFT